MAILTAAEINTIVGTRGERVFLNTSNQAEKDIDRPSEIPVSDPVLPPALPYLGMDANAIGILGKAIAVATPTNNQILKYDSSQDKWVFATDASGGGGTWGSITGTLSSQTDLNTALGLKANTASLATIATSGSASDLSSGTLPLARLTGITTTQLSGTAGITNAQLAGSIAITKLSITGTPDGTKYLRDDATWQPISGAGVAPFVDSTAIIKGSVDATKLLAFEVDGFTTGTTRTLTPQNASYTIAGTNIANTFTSAQVFTGGLESYLGTDQGVILGFQAGMLTPSSDGIRIGVGANGYTATSSPQIVAIGRHAGAYAVGSNAVMIGHAAGQYAYSADNSVIIGSYAGRNPSQTATQFSFSSVIIGDSANTNGVNAQTSTIIGANAGVSATNVVAGVIAGFNAGANATNANNTVIMGSYAGFNSTNAGGSVLIGARAAYNLSRYYSLVIEGHPTYSDAGTTGLIYGEFDNRVLKFNGSTTIQAPANNTTLLTGLRFTDTSPTGNFIKFRNATNSADIFAVSIAGTISAGTWNGSIIESAYGGAGTITGILKANGSGTVSAVTIGGGLTFDGTTLVATAGAGGTVINTSDGVLPYRTNATTFADSPITRVDSTTIQVGTVQVAAINGGTAANDDITIQGTSNATRTTSYVNLQPSGGLVGIGIATPTAGLHVSMPAATVPLIVKVNDAATDLIQTIDSSNFNVFKVQQLANSEGQIRLGAAAGGAILLSKGGVISSTDLNATAMISSGNTVGEYGLRGGFASRYMQLLAGSSGVVSVDGTTKGISVGAGYLSTVTPTNGLIVEGNVGIGTTAPDATLDVNIGTTGSFQLTYNDSNGSATNKVNFAPTSGGNLTVTPSGGLTNLASGLVMSGTPQTLTGAGAVNLTTFSTLIVTTGTDALTLAAGAEGQFKFIKMKTKVGNATLTVTNLEGGTTITFDAVGDFVHLFYQDAKWNVITNSGCAVA
jgi:hypothetical protein